MTYLLFNKQPHVPVNSMFSLLINKNEITKSNSVKYLGVWFDDKLNWSAHIQDMSLQLAKCSSMLYHIRDLLLIVHLQCSTTVLHTAVL